MKKIIIGIFLFFITGASTFAYDISTSTINSTTYDLNAIYGTTIYASELSPDGTKAYILSYTNNKVYEVSLSTPYDLSTLGTSTATYISFSNPHFFNWSDNGENFYVGTNYSSNDKVYHYSCSTAWSMSSCSFSDQKALGTSSSWGAFIISPDGTKAWVGPDSSYRIQEYSLSTPYDISTSSVIATLTTGGTENYFDWSPDGNYLFLSDYGADAIKQYSCFIAWDILSCTDDSLSFSLGGIGNYIYDFKSLPTGEFLAFGSNGFIRLWDNEDTFISLSGGYISPLLETGTGCYDKKEYLGTYSYTPIDFSGYDIAEGGDNDILILSPPDTGSEWDNNVLRFQFSNYDTLSGFTGSVLSDINSFTLSTFINLFGGYSKLEINGYGEEFNYLKINGIKDDLAEVKITYTYENEEYIKSIFSFDDYVRFEGSISGLNIEFQLMDYSISSIELGTSTENYNTTQICKEYISVNGSDISDLTGTGGLLSEGNFDLLDEFGVVGENIKKYVLSIASLFSFGIPVDYEIPFSVPSFLGGGLGTFEKHSVKLDATIIDDRFGYTKTDGIITLEINGIILYSKEEGTFNKFLGFFFPLLFAMLYYVLYLGFVYFLLSPVFYLRKIIVRIINLIFPAEVITKTKNSGNLLIFIAFSVYIIAFLSLSLYLVGNMAYYVGEMSYHFKGVIGHLLNFILLIFKFDGISMFTIITTINISLWGLVVAYVTYMVLLKFGRLN